MLPSIAGPLNSIFSIRGSDEIFILNFTVKSVQNIDGFREDSSASFFSLRVISHPSPDARFFLSGSSISRIILSPSNS